MMASRIDAQSAFMTSQLVRLDSNPEVQSIRTQSTLENTQAPQDLLWMNGDDPRLLDDLRLQLERLNIGRNPHIPHPEPLPSSSSHTPQNQFNCFYQQNSTQNAFQCHPYFHYSYPIQRTFHQPLAKLTKNYSVYPHLRLPHHVPFYAPKTYCQRQMNRINSRTQNQVRKFWQIHDSQISTQNHNQHRNNRPFRYSQNLVHRRQKQRPNFLCIPSTQYPWSYQHQRRNFQPTHNAQHPGNRYLHHQRVFRPFNYRQRRGNQCKYQRGNFNFTPAIQRSGNRPQYQNFKPIYFPQQPKKQIQRDCFNTHPIPSTKHFGHKLQPQRPNVAYTSLTKESGTKNRQKHHNIQSISSIEQSGRRYRQIRNNVLHIPSVQRTGNLYNRQKPVVQNSGTQNQCPQQYGYLNYRHQIQQENSGNRFQIFSSDDHVNGHNQHSTIYRHHIPSLCPSFAGSSGVQLQNTSQHFVTHKQSDHPRNSILLQNRNSPNPLERQTQCPRFPYIVQNKYALNGRNSLPVNESQHQPSPVISVQSSLENLYQRNRYVYLYAQDSPQNPYQHNQDLQTVYQNQYERSPYQNFYESSQNQYEQCQYCDRDSELLSNDQHLPSGFSSSYHNSEESQESALQTYPEICNESTSVLNQHQQDHHHDFHLSEQSQCPNQYLYDPQQSQYPSQSFYGSEQSQYSNQYFHGSQQGQYPNQYFYGSQQSQFPNQYLYGSQQGQYPSQSFYGSEQSQYSNQYFHGSQQGQYPKQYFYGSQQSQFPNQYLYGSQQGQYPSQSFYGSQQSRYPNEYFYTPQQSQYQIVYDSQLIQYQYQTLFSPQEYQYQYQNSYTSVQNQYLNDSLQIQTQNSQNTQVHTLTSQNQPNLFQQNARTQMDQMLSQRLQMQTNYYPQQYASYQKQSQGPYHQFQRHQTPTQYHQMNEWPYQFHDLPGACDRQNQLQYQYFYLNQRSTYGYLRNLPLLPILTGYPQSTRYSFPMPLWTVPFQHYTPLQSGFMYSPLASSSHNAMMSGPVYSRNRRPAVSPYSPRPYSNESVILYHNFLRLRYLFPDLNPAALHTLLEMCNGNFTRTIDNIIYTKRVKNNLVEKFALQRHRNAFMMYPPLFSQVPGATRNVQYSNSSMTFQSGTAGPTSLNPAQPDILQNLQARSNAYRMPNTFMTHNQPMGSNNPLQSPFSMSESESYTPQQQRQQEQQKSPHQQQRTSKSPEHAHWRRKLSYENGTDEMSPIMPEPVPMTPNEMILPTPLEPDVVVQPTSSQTSSGTAAYGSHSQKKPNGTMEQEWESSPLDYCLVIDTDNEDSQGLHIKKEGQKNEQQ